MHAKDVNRSGYNMSIIGHRGARGEAPGKYTRRF